MKILLIEDDKKIAKAINSILETHCYVVDTAYDGMQSSFMARTNNYDLIILDYILPKKDGLQVANEIRDDKNDTPIIMLTIRFESEEKVKLFEAGVDDYVVKPFSYSELIARIKAVLRRGKKINEDEVLTACEITLNRPKYEVKNSEGKTLHMRKKEFCLLYYLMKNKNKVVTKSELIEHVWDINADLFSNTVECHILRTRQSLKKLTKKQIITTITGVGYKIIDN